MEISIQRKYLNEVLLPEFIKENQILIKDSWILNIGKHLDFHRYYRKLFERAGCRSYEDLDIQKNLEPDIVGNFETLTFEDLKMYQYSVVFCNGMYEYFTNPFKAVRKIQLLLRPEGKLIFGAPYKMGNSGFWRLTEAGMRQLLRNFTIEKSKVIAEPGAEQPNYFYAIAKIKEKNEDKKSLY